MTTQDELLPDDWAVLVNDEEQYSLWPVANALPAGWRAVISGLPRAAASAYVEAHWVDMRPKSVRGEVATDARGSTVP